MKTEFVVWWCKDGHELKAHPGATAVWCGLAGHKGTNEMRQKEIFPSWGRRTVRIECSWCHRVMQEGDGDVSHTICEPCSKVLLQKADA